jgi:Type IV secretion system pilin
MNKKLTKLYLFMFGILNPLYAYAVDPEYDKNTVKLENPLGGAGGITSVSEFIKVIIDLVLTIAVPVLVLAFIWLGFQFVLSQGNATKLEKVKQNLWYTIIGVAIVLGAKAVSELIQATFISLSK